MGNKNNVFRFNKSAILIVLLILYLFPTNCLSQISPGDLAEAHSHLEGMSNCTECHTLGQKVSNDKCLTCHKPLKERIDSNSGYHSSSEISGKQCVICHSDHHGKKFQMIRFEKESFNHKLTGYELEGAHIKQECSSCHKKQFISQKEIQQKKYTYLGLSQDCKSCHDDYHQESLSSNCLDCHNFNSFKETPKFDHNNTKFMLLGKHENLKCIDCHLITQLNGKKFQEFSGIEFNNCTSCHKDIHENKFGQNCTNCHSEQSFHVIKSMGAFDHNNTNFKLENKHLGLDCKKCHKSKLTDAVKHSKCTDCHTDYHQNEFVKEGVVEDCSSCHDSKGFEFTSFDIENHQKLKFQLKGSHLATPCFVCHKDENTWKFRNIGNDCKDCHENIHKTYISPKYYPDENCTECHNENVWNDIKFDHLATGYKLESKHKSISCAKCHMQTSPEGLRVQRFKGLDDNCINCHKDIHQKQFDNEGVTNCLKCHDYSNWKPNRFKHEETRFPLDGKHINVDCYECHKKEQKSEDTYVIYKLNTLKCEDCH